MQSGSRKFRFGVFEVDLGSRELRRRGIRPPLQDQPFRVLEALLEKPGEIVTREELRRRLWADDEFVEFDKSLNTAVQKIRRALGDSAASPRFVETVPRMGYRFLASIEPLESGEASERGIRWIRPAAALAAVAAAVVIMTALRSRPRTTELRFVERPLTYAAGSEDRPAFSPDGTRVAYQADGDRPGESDILITLTEVGAGSPVRVTRGPSRDIEPAWSPDGKRLVFARILEERPNHVGTTFKLMLAPPVAGTPVQELTDQTFVHRNAGGISPSWSADGEHIVFSCRLDPASAQVQICVYSLSRREAWPLTPSSGSGVGDNRPSLSPDGKTLVYQASSRPGEVGLYFLSLSSAMRPQGEPWPVSGARGSHRPAWSRDGKTVFFTGTDIDGKPGLWSVDPESNEPARLLWPVGARSATFWQDKRGSLHVAYAKRVEDAELVRVDLQRPQLDDATVLAPSNFADYHPQFSHDGRSIAFMSARSGTFGVWICDADGKNARALADVGPYAYFSGPMWSPDGKEIAVDGFHGARNAHIVNVSTKQVGPALTSREGRMPTWSETGRRLWYYSHVGGSPALWIIDLATKESVKVRDAPGIMDIDEAPDGEALYFIQGDDLMRLTLQRGEPAGAPEKVASQVAAFALADRSIYIRNLSGAIYKIDGAGSKTTVVLQTDGRQDVPNLGIAVSPDERWLVYTRWLRREMDLQLLEEIR